MIRMFWIWVEDSLYLISVVLKYSTSSKVHITYLIRYELTYRAYLLIRLR